MSDASDLTNGPPRVTGHIAAVISQLKFSDLPDDVVSICKHTFLDWLAVTLAGESEPLAQMIGADVLDQGAAERVTMIGRDARTSPSLAALFNGAAAHALDYDDTNFKAFGHVSAALIPALLALAEDLDVSGERFLTGLVAGFEASGRAGSLVSDAHYERGFHSTGTIGTFAAAGACANLAGLDAYSTAMAFGISAAQAAGIKSMFGTMCKPLHAGKAAQNGLLAVSLAKRGFVSNPDALECQQGFARTHSPVICPEAAMAEAEAGFYIRHNLFKYHASCYLTHAPAKCAIRLRTEHGISPENIAEIRIGLEPAGEGTCDIRNPQTGLEAKFSVAQVVALELAGFDTSSLEPFSGRGIESPILTRLREATQIRFDPELTRASAELEVVLLDGSRYTARHNASMPMQDLDEQGHQLLNKFMRLATPKIGETRAKHLADLVSQVERLSSLKEITELCRPA